MRIEVCVIISDFELKKVILFTSLCTFGHAGSLLLHGLFSSCGKWGLPLVAVHELLTEVVSLVVEHGSGALGFSTCST